MRVFKIDITSWTASFRYPNLISGFQPTLEVPPVSTVLGLINAAAGHYVAHSTLKLGYYFEYQSKAVDLETIYQIGAHKGMPSNHAKSNIIRREFLFEAFLRLYVTSQEVADYFRSPVYPIVLGRMNDLASIAGGVRECSLVPRDHADQLRGQVVPFSKHQLPGQIQALPKYFTDSFPRNNLGVEPYSVIGHGQGVSARLEAFRDEEKEVDVYFHDLSF
ncbi:type I-B CRISPR-associated protein Cas5b [Microscilla marina]|uniref:Crispr-associated protein Cas5, tneap subtype n=1 Tax=Microscilla marina ATCC 23134 TaxID=313606 RepID=A1ZVP9_MICM2|nr:type I-B CRISPR-associated protein Cas5b [Microscilla marina]EAY25592.1 crispr-associated protein Cas5, tneap subtype [Microscilla marina ATCC 23134]